MSHTSWKLAGLNPATVALPYVYRAGRLSSAGHHGAPDDPNGELRSSALDMSRFLRAFMNGGILQGRRILSAALVAQMGRVQVPHLDPNLGLVWYYYNVGGYRVLGHEGAEIGVGTDMFFRPHDRVGALVFSNTSADDEGRQQDQSNALADIEERILRLA